MLLFLIGGSMWLRTQFVEISSREIGRRKTRDSGRYFRRNSRKNEDMEA